MLQIVLNDRIYNFDDLIENFAIKRGRSVSWHIYIITYLKKKIIITVTWTKCKCKFAHQQDEIRFLIILFYAGNLLLFFFALTKNDNSKFRKQHQFNKLFSYLSLIKNNYIFIFKLCENISFFSQFLFFKYKPNYFMTRYICII